MEIFSPLLAVRLDIVPISISTRLHSSPIVVTLVLTSTVLHSFHR
nr:MAG TPA: hypothetical protein [Caudoviricetes sp.]